MKKLIVEKYIRLLEIISALTSFIKWVGSFIVAWISYLILKDWLIPYYEDAFNQEFASLTIRSLFSTIVNYILILLGSLFIAAVAYFIVEAIIVAIKEHKTIIKNRNNFPLTYEEERLLQESKSRSNEKSQD